MKNQYNKVSVGILVAFEIYLGVLEILYITSGQWPIFILTFMVMLSLTLPWIVTWAAKRIKVDLPSSFQIITFAFIVLAQYLGELKGFYQLFWWWDLLLHTIFGSYAVVVALQLINGTITKHRKVTIKRYKLGKSIFAFSIAIALGTLWELFEFAGDYFFKTNMIKGGLEDTITDLLVKTGAAFITAMLYFWLFHKDLDY